MARPPKFRDEDILTAAREVFLARGIRATTAEVAQRAGVSEGTLFHRFKSKEALFRAALTPDVEDPPDLAGLVARAGQGTVAENLADALLAAIDALRTRVPLAMMTVCNPGPEGFPERVIEHEHPATQIVRNLAGYTELEVRLGRLRRIDPEIFARGLMGSVMEYVMAEIVHASPYGLPLPAQTFVRGLVDLFLHGAAPHATPQRPVNAPRRTRRSVPNSSTKP